MMVTNEDETGVWQSNQLTAARKQINDIDDEIVALLAQRFDAVTKVNEAKAAANLPIMDHGREDQVLDRVTGQDSNPATKRYMRNIFATIMKNSREYQDFLTKTNHQKGITK
ncbi:chorismate mutase [Lactobacillus sp. LC28-10]|uniref:Chorismate mutase n=1 Tax=Secundilactobacillus angelensis TaxID=2722706 RepID=A0ABX1L2Y6_9LACO|nr:chorismate mutase [Secundilactobacillus angelensis]MCH5463370.1 chorismate mutase [Secundilactobacillus angelensis]NLR19403.1 chorismate mutase [Secundilactobacillus angelensis]